MFWFQAVFQDGLLSTGSVRTSQAVERPSLMRELNQLRFSIPHPSAIHHGDSGDTLHPQRCSQSLSF